MSNEHFTVDGTLIEAWASMKSFKKKDSPKGPSSGLGRGNPEANFHGEKRTNETRTSTTDPEAKLMRKGLGKEAKLCFSAHSLMENRNGLLVGLRVDAATGYAERSNALLLLDDAQLTRSRIALGADKGYDARDFVAGCRQRDTSKPCVSRSRNPRRLYACELRSSRANSVAVAEQHYLGMHRRIAEARTTLDAAMLRRR
jgi:hypothetical protein